MFNRLSKSEYACFLALAASLRSEDNVTFCGTAIFDENYRTISTGMNGFSKGFKPSEELFLEHNRELKSKYITHSEINALMCLNGQKPYYAASNYSPCIFCTKAIIGSGVKHYFYLKQYLKAGKEPDLEFMEIFNFYGIKYQQLTKENIVNILVTLDYCKEFLWRI